MKEQYIETNTVQSEPYLAARALNLLPILYGERGKIVVKTYAYFRSVDNRIDKTTESIEEKLGFLQRQSQVIKRRPVPHPTTHESMYLNLPWDIFPEQTLKSIDTQAQILLSTFVDDVRHFGFQPRNYRETRHYNWRTLLPCLEAISLIINGKPMKVTSRFMHLLNSCNSIGSLQDFEEDVDRKLLQVPFSRDEITLIARCTNEEEKRARALEIYNSGRFEAEKARHIDTLKTHNNAFMDLDIPFWQKAVCTAYLTHRAIKKAQTHLMYPFIPPSYTPQTAWQHQD